MWLRGLSRLLSGLFSRNYLFIPLFSFRCLILDNDWAQQEEAKSEHVEEKEVETVEQDVPNPVKEYDDDEDDFMKWSQYTSEVWMMLSFS